MHTPPAYKGNYVQGHFLKIQDPNGEIFSSCPGDLERKPTAIAYSYEHVFEAVEAGRRSFTSWRRRSAKDRGELLSKYRDELVRRTTEIAETVTYEIGKPLWEAKQEIEDTARLISEYILQIQSASLEEKVEKNNFYSGGTVRYLPRGVAAIVSPAPQPVYASHAHFIPALAFGNTVVVKASSYAPLTGQLIAEVAHQAGLPAGVFNLVQGESEVSRRLVSHSAVDMVLFTGDHETGIKIAKQLAADPSKILVLETGGKNAVLVWEDAGYEQALFESLQSAFLTTGQRCSSAGRILVHEKLFDKFVADFHKLSKACKIGLGSVEGKDAPFMGPLISEEAMEHYLRYQGIAVREGCEELMRGKALDRDKKGYYVSPSIHLVPAHDPKSVYQKSEVHGPDVAIFRVSETDEVAEILNHPQHNLITSVYCQSSEIFHSLSHEIVTGMLHWNAPTTKINTHLPVGGLKKSGNSRPMGGKAMDQCMFPMSLIEGDKSFDAAQLPQALPRLEK